MAMRSKNGYAYCEECDMFFASGPDDKNGTTTHPTFDQWPDMRPELVERYKRCPNAGKTFKHPVMEEVISATK